MEWVYDPLLGNEKHNHIYTSYITIYRILDLGTGYDRNGSGLYLPLHRIVYIQYTHSICALYRMKGTVVAVNEERWLGFL